MDPKWLRPGPGETPDSNHKGLIIVTAVLMVVVLIFTFGVAVFGSLSFYSRRQVGCQLALEELEDVVAGEKFFVREVRHKENNLIEFVSAKTGHAMTSEDLRSLFESEKEAIDEVISDLE